MIVSAIAAGLSFLNPSPLPTTLGPLAQRINLNLGAAVDSGTVHWAPDRTSYQQAILNNCTMIEPENDLKPPSLWQGVGQYSFDNADYLVNWAVSNKLKVRGHVLVYARDDGYTIPGWLLAMENSITTDQARQMLRDYIYTVVGRYKGKIFAWDVMNEAIDDHPNGNPFNLRNSFWFRKLGRAFVLDAFRYARLADPECKLYYNEYNVESGGWKADSMLGMLAYLRARRVRVDGVGLQFHRGVGDQPNPGDGYYSMLTRIRANGLSFMITELDISVPVFNYPQGDPNFGIIPVNSNDLQVQATNYRAYFRMALSYPNCMGIQTWGETDAHSWIPWFSGGNRGAALLLDGSYNNKPALEAVANELRLH